MEIGVIRVIGIQVSLKLGKFSYMKFVANIQLLWLITYRYPHTPLLVEVCVAEPLTPRTLDLEVPGSSLASRVDSLDKELIPLCLSSPRCG